MRKELRRWGGRTVLAGLVASMLAAVPGFAVAAPVAAGADGSRIDHVVTTDARRSTVYVYSAAMDRVIALDLLRPADTSRPRPTLYLLDGAEDGIGANGAETSWETKTDLAAFTADQNLNVVTVLDGRYSYYTDWAADDPRLGRNRWTTFLTRELPPLLDSYLGASGRNAIAGVSMSATSALALAEAAPGLYRSVGSFSGCDQTSVDPGRRYLQAVVLSGGGNPWNIWGPDGAPGWAANDPSTDANLMKLRGVDLYIAAGTGGPATDGRPANPSGGMLESVVADCTHRLQDSTTRLGIPATYRYVPGGQHAWPYWQDDLHAAWPELTRPLGITS
ncbi:esterase family protein [Nocardia terpenica]|uniref:alpha/beta hydrolase n=1 Tax=Nocardia terpenica TaxID=455432 RepID=UPI00189385C9|nr:alpha/beta hydrolase family protein [Nocardia terpenica]MBF6065612.1 esterase family protein [Nocardia terpenica]MBF6115616.1 esterase family protein [Nocardia terpenica]MBF6122857.1 esterase family protein [Nocardia terpenica]MBF6155791.1 esterase family protein [Nocardia terpenica]